MMGKNHRTAVRKENGMANGMTKRKTGFDILRITAMLGIILFHHFGSRMPNNFVQLSEGFSETSYFYDFINNTAVTAGVSKLSLVMDFCYGHLGDGGNFIFMLITGYFLFGHKISFPKSVRTAAKIFFAILYYAAILTVIDFILVRFFYPFSNAPSFRPIFTLPNWVGGENVWYLQAYGIFILVILPILKIFEDKLTRKTHLCLVAALILVNFFAYNTYLPNLWISYRMLNFIMCYYAGGYVAKYHVRVSGKKLFTALAVYMAAYFLYEYYWRFSSSAMWKPYEYSYINYMAPFICTLSWGALLFLIFNNIPSGKRGQTKLLTSLSSATIGILIFHYNMIDISFLLADSFWWKDWSQKGYFRFCIIDSILLFAIGFLLDAGRKIVYAHIEAGAARRLCRQTGREEGGPQ